LQLYLVVQLLYQNILAIDYPKVRQRRFPAIQQ
jgi:hypothetical protein